MPYDALKAIHSRGVQLTIFAHAHMSAHERERFFFNSNMQETRIINYIKFLVFATILLVRNILYL